MIKDLKTQTLVTLPDAMSFPGPFKRVSSTSQWGDPTWQLDTDTVSYGDSRVALHWHDEIGEPQLELLKKLIWSVLAEPSGNRVATVTLAGLYGSLRILGTFMTRGEYVDFAELDQTAVGFLTSNLREKAMEIDEAAYADMDPEDADSDDSTMSAGEGFDWSHWDSATTGVLSFGIVHGVYRVIAMLHRQRRSLQRIGVSMPEEDPLGGETAHAWALKVRVPAERDVDPLSDEIALPLLLAVDRLMGIPADDLIALQRQYLAARGFANSDHVTKRQRQAGLDVLLGHQFSRIRGEASEWHPALPNAVEAGEARVLYATLLRLVVLIRDAAVLSLLQLTGMRIGEILALRSGIEADTGLPSCILRTRSASGDRYLYYAESIISKGRVAPEREIWLVGSAPVGSSALPVTIRSLLVLNELLEPWRAISNDKRISGALLISFAGYALPEGAGGVLRATSANIRVSLKRSLASLIDWESIPDQAKSGIDLRPFKRSRGSFIRATHWRKTFAANIVRTDSRLLNALRRHFKHMSLATTEGHYVGHKVEILEAIDEAQLQMSMRFLRDKARGGPPTIGRTGSVVKRNLKRIRLMDEEGFPRLGSDLGEVLRSAETSFIPADHGNCAISFSPGTAACHQLDSAPSFLNTLPNYKRQEADLCASCRCFVADESNLPFWQNRFLENNAAKRAQMRMNENASASVFGDKARRAYLVIRALRRGRLTKALKSQSSNTPARDGK